MLFRAAFHRRLRVAAGLFALSACAAGNQSFDDTLEDIFDESGAMFQAQLRGASARPAGDQDGTGVARIRIDAADDRLCATIEVGGIGPVTGAHLHRGSSRITGAALLALDPPDADRSDDCQL